ncbi:O-antigen ligase [Granulicella mallensis]|jgi:hypothetical protein|uniref:O-antigen ligase-related domain-containing protein n=1 Tax=Granulicella mallensis TaxID=940614 RepID=A0A7W8EAL6_9BACT|nr:O-antigen ligase family protein [Granulicella mallensis]MBB5063620.1 hypothetical protein [Granulicella mallensis]
MLSGMAAPAAPLVARLDFSPFLERGFEFLFGLYVFLTISLPSSSMYGINLKTPLYAFMLPMAVYCYFRRGQASRGSIVLMVIVPTTMLLWMVLGLSQGIELAGAARQYLDIFLTFLTCWLVFVFCGQSERQFLRFVKIVVYSEAAAALFKFGIILYAFRTGVSITEVVSSVDKIFGVDLMTMDIGDLFGRIQFMSDELVPLCIYVILRYRDRLGLSSFRSAVLMLLLFVSVLISFSRYFWGFTALAFVLGLLVGKKDRFTLVLASALGLSVLLSLPFLIDLYQLRFSADLAGGSDDIRVEQIRALVPFFQDSPLWGHGFGSFTHQVIRSDDNPYTYEVQLLALLGQLGIVGMLLLALLTAFYYRTLWWKSQVRTLERVSILLLLMAWIAGGLSNPIVFLPIAGINFAALRLLAEWGADSRVANARPLRCSDEKLHRLQAGENLRQSIP